MPDNNNNDALIAAGINAAGQVGSASIVAGQNKKGRQFAREMYDIQRKDALADWAMQNEYNSPAAQMKRLQAAGLNPNLVYGSGTVANNASQPRSSNFDAPQQMPIKFDTGSIVNDYYDTKFRQAQTDNLQAQRRVIEQDAALRAAQIASVAASTAKTGQDTKTGEFNLEQARKLQAVTVETAEASLRKINAETDYTLDNNERQAALSANTIAQGAEAILRSRAERTTNEVQRRKLEQDIQSVQRDVRLKDLDINLKKLGIMPNDPMWSRVLGRIVGDPKVQEKAKDIISGEASKRNDDLKNNAKYKAYLESKKKR